MIFPSYVHKALTMLENNTGEAYVVGGAVRDILMGRKPHDYDITTSLVPEQVIQCLTDNGIPVVKELGNNFGVVTGVFEGTPVEIATYRTDHYDSDDAHRPASVSFCTSLQEDLARRDFTINAMAMDKNGILVDPFGGKEDIEKKHLRPVGRAEDRYREDALRMYRACRFSAQLGFVYTENGNSITGCFVRPGFVSTTRVGELSMERVRTEMQKMLDGKYPDMGLRLFMGAGLSDKSCVVKRNGKNTYVYPFRGLSHLYHLPQSKTHHMYNAWEHTIHAVRNAPKHLRWAMLFHDAGKGLPSIRSFNEEKKQITDYNHEKESAKIAVQALDDLQIQEKEIRYVKWLILHHMDFVSLMNANPKTVKYWVRKNKTGFYDKKTYETAVKDLTSVFLADLKASKEQDLAPLKETMASARAFIRSNIILHTKELNVSGDEVIAKIQGKDIKPADIFNFLKEQVCNEQAENKHDELMSVIDRKIKRIETMKKSIQGRSKL